MVDFAPAFDDTEPYDEFGCVAENAAEMGVAVAGRHLPQRTRSTLGSGQSLSVIRWGTADPEFVFLHGGGQNAAHVGQCRRRVRASGAGRRPSGPWALRQARAIAITARGRTRRGSPR